jgi:hypothetical protein
MVSLMTGETDQDRAWKRKANPVLLEILILAAQIQAELYAAFNMTRVEMAPDPETTEAEITVALESAQDAWGQIEELLKTLG